MPELPEVETIRRGLAPHVVGRPIHEIVADSSRVMKTPPQMLADAARGQCILDLGRRGKNLIFELERHCCIIHLGMTGQLTFRDPAQPDSGGFIRHEVTGLQRIRQHPPDKHTHLQILFRDGGAILFRDVRKFGKVLLFEKGSEGLNNYLGRLGMEPFSKNYSLERFLAFLKGRRVQVKPLLLNQAFVAGVGNIYADEALFESRVHPARRVDTLKPAERKRLFKAIPGVLAKGVDFGGTSLRDYVNSDGESGSNQEELNVYGREGQPCRSCGRLVERIVLNQRSTHFCPKCQK